MTGGDAFFLERGDGEYSMRLPGGLENRSCIKEFRPGKCLTSGRLRKKSTTVRLWGITDGAFSRRSDWRENVCPFKGHKVLNDGLDWRLKPLRSAL